MHKMIHREPIDKNLLFDVFLDMGIGNIYWKNLEGVYIGCNQAQLEMAQLSRDEFVGNTDYDMPWKEQAQQIMALDKEVILQNKTVISEEKATLKDNTVHYYLSKKSPVISEGKVIGLLGISIDITSQKLNEQLKKDIEVAHEKIKALEAVAGTIAHELRTPLASIKNAIEIIHNRISGETVDLKNESLSLLPSIFKEISESVQFIASEIQYTQMTINMLLINMRKQDDKTIPLKNTSIKESIETALNRFPHSDQESKALIHLQLSHNFNFNGNDLFIHVIFNLIKNSLYFIERAGKGRITIWSEIGEKVNYLHFRDTGTGIKLEHQCKLFQRFFTTERTGTGLGLSFCKTYMTNIGGDITCHSKENEFTEFVLSFPNVEVFG